MTVATQAHRHVARDLTDALAVVRAHGLRLTGARRLVLETLFVVDQPVSADEIAAGLGGALPASDLASVYRNLERLEQLGLICHVHFGHGAALFELTRAEPCVYGLCERCRTVTAVPSGELDAARTALEWAFGIEPHLNHFPIVGLCRSCRRAASRDRRHQGRQHAHS